MFEAATVLRRLGVPVRDLFCDSRRPVRGGIFVARPGEREDGRLHIADALKSGAAGVLWDPDGFSWSPDLNAPNVPVPHLGERVGFFADEVYGAPSHRLFVAAITGTNGKTTTAWFAAQLLSQGGLPTGVVGTLGAGMWGEEMSPPENTTPDAIVLHRFLRDFADSGARAAVMEASSHGIAQGRLAGVRLAAAALLNIRHDHLDYHGDMESYRKTKIGLLQSESLHTAIVNADDEFAAAAAANACAEKIMTFGERGDTLRLCGVSDSEEGRTLFLDGEEGKRECFLRPRGAHNAANFMAAALIARAAGVPWRKIDSAALTLPHGRLQRINPGGAPAVYVDYAHTPDALSAVLDSFSGRRGRLWLVFGCGGNRDLEKRREMGRIAASCADVAIITDDNPRDESPRQIRAAVMAGGVSLREIAGRGDAIAAAIKDAAKNDTVIIAGKGHEEYQDIGGARRPFSDAETARECLRVRGGAGC